MEPRSESGGFLPSGVLLLSVAALVMAGVTFVVTQNDKKVESEQVINVTADPTPTVDPTTPSAKPTKKPTKKPEVVVDRSKVRVEVYNTSAIKGLAADVNDRLAELGWAVGTPDNWPGKFPESTVYYAPGYSAEAEQLALDLGLKLVKPALGQMIKDGLSLILVGPLDS